MNIRVFQKTLAEEDERVMVIPWEDRVLFFDGIGQETGRAEVDDDRTRINGAKMLSQNSIFESPSGIGLRALQSVGTFGHRFVEDGEHFVDRRSENKKTKNTVGLVSECKTDDEKKIDCSWKTEDLEFRDT